MRFIITSDIHGNDIAYSAVLNEVKEKYANKVDAFLDLGDISCDFLWGEEVCQIMRYLADKSLFYGVTGNRETGMIIPYYNAKKNNKIINWDINSTMGAPLLSCNRMSDDTFKFINNLPDTLLIKFIDNNDSKTNEKNIVYIKTDIIPLPSPIFLKHKMPLTEEEIDLLKKEKCSTILTAHTHINNSNNYDGFDIYNAGSVGLTGDGIKGADYGELFFKNGKWNFISNHIEYDYDKLKEKVYENEILFKKCKNWGTALISAIDEGINVPALYMFEKNRILEELTKNSSKITLDPNDNVTITTMGRFNADVDYKGEPLKYDIFFGSNIGIELKKFFFNREEKSSLNNSVASEDIFNLALSNVLFYIEEAKKKSTTQYEILTGRLKK